MARDLDTTALRAFLAVADLGGFTRAAPRLHRSQSAVSMMIKKLEESVGAQLFERAADGVRMTAHGEKFASYARRMIELHDAAMEEMRGASVSGSVRIGVMDDYATHILPPIFADFKKRNPSVDLEVTTGMTAELLDALGSAYDLVLATQALGAGGGRKLRADDVCWAYSAARPAPEERPLPLAMLGPNNLFRGWAIRALDAAGIPWRVVFTSTSISAVEAAAEAGMAVTVVKRRTARPGLRPLGRSDGMPPLPTAEIALHRAATASSAAVGRLAEHLEQRIGAGA